MSFLTSTRALTICLWLALALSLMAWMAAGYSRMTCLIALVPLLAPLNGLLRGQRYTYSWATLLAVPYMAFAITELLVNRDARWVAALTLLLLFAWFCTMILYLRASRALRG